MGGASAGSRMYLYPTALHPQGIVVERPSAREFADALGREPGPVREAIEPIMRRRQIVPEPIWSDRWENRLLLGVESREPRPEESVDVAPWTTPEGTRGYRLRLVDRLRPWIEWRGSALAGVPAVFERVRYVDARAYLTLRETADYRLPDGRVFAYERDVLDSERVPLDGHAEARFRLEVPAGTPVAACLCRGRTAGPGGGPAALRLAHALTGDVHEATAPCAGRPVHADRVRSRPDHGRRVGPRLRRDATGAVLPGVTVTATSPTVPGAFLATSDGEGYYRLLELPPGAYALTYELDGFTRLSREGIVVRAGTNVSVDVTMSIGALTDTIEVRVETPMLEARSVEQSVNISGDFQRSVPLSRAARLGRLHGGHARRGHRPVPRRQRPVLHPRR